MNLLLLIVHASLLLSGIQASKLASSPDIPNAILNDFQNKQQSDPHELEESSEQDVETILNQALQTEKGNSIPISQSKSGSFSDLRSDQDKNRSGNEGTDSRVSNDEEYENLSSIKLTQSRSQGSVQDANRHGNEETNIRLSNDEENQNLSSLKLTQSRAQGLQRSVQDDTRDGNEGTDSRVDNPEDNQNFSSLKLTQSRAQELQGSAQDNNRHDNEGIDSRVSKDEDNQNLSSIKLTQSRAQGLQVSVQDNNPVGRQVKFNHGSIQQNNQNVRSLQTNQLRNTQRTFNQGESKQQNPNFPSVDSMQFRTQELQKPTQANNPRGFQADLTEGHAQASDLHSKHGSFNQGNIRQGENNFPSIRSTQFGTQGLRENSIHGNKKDFNQNNIKQGNRNLPSIMSTPLGTQGLQVSIPQTSRGSEVNVNQGDNRQVNQNVPLIKSTPFNPQHVQTIHPHGSQRTFNEGNIKQNNLNFPSINSAQFRNQEFYGSVQANDPLSSQGTFSKNNFRQGNHNFPSINSARIRSQGLQSSTRTTIPHGDSRTFNQANVHQENQSVPSIKSTSGPNASALTTATGFSQGGSFNDNARQNSVFFNPNNDIPQNVGTSVSNMDIGNIHSSTRVVHSNAQNELSAGLGHSQGASNLGFGINQGDNSIISGNSHVSDISVTSNGRITNPFQATDSPHDTLNAFAHDVSGSGFHRNKAAPSNAATGPQFSQISSLIDFDTQFRNSLIGSVRGIYNGNTVRHHQQNIRANAGFQSGNVDTGNAFNIQSNTNNNNEFRQSGVTNQGGKSQPEIFRGKLIHEASAPILNFDPLGQTPSVRTNNFNANHIGPLGTGRDSRAQSGFSRLRQNHVMQPLDRGLHNLVSLSNINHFGNRGPTSQFVQQQFQNDFNNQGSSNHADTQRNINNVGHFGTFNPPGAQNEQTVNNALAQQSGISSQSNQRPQFLRENQSFHGSIAQGNTFNNFQKADGLPNEALRKRQRLVSDGQNTSPNTFNRGFGGSLNSQIIRPQTLINNPNQSDLINQGFVGNIENGGPHGRSLNTRSNNQFHRSQGRLRETTEVEIRTHNELYNVPNNG